MKVLTLFAVLLLAAACGGGAAGTPAGPGATGVTPTSAPTTGPTSAPTEVGQPTAQPPAGAGSAVVVLTGGPDAGTYTGNENPNCSQGLIGPDGWGVQYSTASVDDNGLGSVQIVAAAEGMENDEDAFFDGVSLLTTITIGPSLGEASRDYEIKVSDDDTASGSGTATVTDNGSTAVIHATGTTEDGVGIDATITCPSIIRA